MHSYRSDRAEALCKPLEFNRCKERLKDQTWRPGARVSRLSPTRSVFHQVLYSGMADRLLNFVRQKFSLSQTLTHSSQEEGSDGQGAVTPMESGPGTR
jgi:hypothetical protein